MHTTFSKIIVSEDEVLYPAESTFCTLMRNICFTEKFEAALTGFAPEKIIQAYDDLPNCRFTLLPKTIEPLQIACVIPGRSADGLYVFQLVSLLNRFTSIRFSLYAKPAIVNEIISLCNEHISVLAFSAKEKINIQTHMVLTYGLRALHLLKTGVPVFILGPNGLGGLATAANIPFLFKFRFMGRPGGSLHENIPITIMTHELGLYKDIENIEGFIHETKTIAYTLPINAISEEKKIQQVKCNQLQEAYDHKAGRENLRPVLCSNMQIIRSNDAFIIRRSGLHDTICTLDTNDASLIKDMTGALTCGVIREKHGMAYNDFWKIIDILLQKEIITVNL